MSKIKAIFYDAGMTLLHPYPPVEEVSMAVCERQGLAADFGAICRGVDVAWGYFHESLRTDNQLFSSETAINRMWVEYYRTVFSSAKVSDDDRVLRECAEAVLAAYTDLENWRAFPETEETLAKFHKEGYVQGVISDWGIGLRPILHRLGLTRYLDFVVGSADVGAAKPNSQLFQLALKRANVLPDEAIHVGDSYWTDVLGARGANVTPVLLDRGGRHVSFVDCAVVRSLDELLPLVRNGLLKHV